MVAQVATPSRTSNGHKLKQLVAECDWKNAPEQLRKKQKNEIEKGRWSMRLWLRSDKRHEQSKERTPAPKAAASTSHDLRETPIELGPNPKKRLLRKPASSGTSCSGQQQVQSSAPDAETEAPN